MAGQIQLGGPYVFGLEHVPLPSVACDSKGNICWSNEHFNKMMGQRDIPPGTPITDIIELVQKGTSLCDLSKIATDTSAPVPVIIKETAHVMYVGVAGDLFSCVFVPETVGTALDVVPTLPRMAKISSIPPTGNKLLEALISISRELNLTMGEEELIQLFVKTYENLFPGRLLCIRLVNPDTMELTQVYANGRLNEMKRDKIQLTRTAWDQHGLNKEEEERFLVKNKFEIVDEYKPIFQNGVFGFDVPLYDGNTYYGVLNFEYDENGGPIVADRPVVAPLAHQMCAALRNASLLAEIVMLKDYQENIFDKANAPMIVVKRNGEIVEVNLAFERLTGYDRADILNTRFLTLLPEADRAETRALSTFLNLVRGESTSNVEFRIARANNKGIAHIAFNIAVIPSPADEQESAIFVGQDLTEVRSLENQIIHSEKLATLGQVAAGVAHELNNPLTSITVYASYLAKKFEGQLDEPDLAKIRRIVESAGRIQTFSRDLVAYARPSGEEPVLFEVSSLVERALSFCEHLIEGCNADVTLNISENLKSIYGIRGQLEQVLVNLITNACHALRNDGGMITIASKSIDDDRIELSVRDTGRGIPKDIRDNVFEPFFTTKAEGQGTGLGLSIVRNIILNHNAEIDVESKVGTGTIFTIKLYTGA